MAHARISANFPPNIDPTKAPIAFGRRALPKLNEELQSPELLTQQRALMALCDLVHDPQNVYEALELGVLDNLKTLLVHQDNTVRQKTTEILHIMTTHNVGRHGLIQNGVISALAELFDDPVDICRKNAHLIFEYMSKLTEGAVGILHAGLIPLLVSKLKNELEEIQELILGTLSNCLRVEASEALAADVITVLKEKNLSVTHEPKNILVCEEVIPMLVSLLEDADPEIQASATGALMFATIKPQALGAGAIPPLLKLAAEEGGKARLSAIKALTMLAELPKGRETLLNHLDTFQQCLKDPSKAVRRAAKTAISVIQWKPY
uniref:RSP14 protein n=1 Tax=Amazona collaria TaxID=241587 RepID=A0A8B9FZB7_9PSIT